MFPKNPFVILHLPANATSAEIRAAGQIAIATMRLVSSQNISAIREVEGAIEALRDPVLRFTTGLHWISLGSEAAKLLQLDPEFEKLSERPRIDRGPAIDRLLKDEIKHCKDHGQAVFSLMRAYALLSSKPSNDEILNCTKLLGVGIAAWIRATSAPEFWIAQRFRAREIHDPRVGAELLKKCQETAIDTVFQPFIELAIESLRAHNGQLCKSIVEVLMNCNVDKSTTDRLMGQVLEQFCRDLEGVVNLLVTRLKSIQAADRVAPFQELFDDYLAQVDPKIDLLLFIGDLPGTSEERVRDAAASFLRNHAVYSANSAKDYKFSIGVLTFAVKAAYSNSIRCELVEIAKVLANNQKNVDPAGDAKGRLKRKEELLSTVAAALVRSDYKTALKILDEIIALNPASSVAEIDTVFQPFIQLLLESLHAHNGQVCKSIVEVLMNCNVDKSTTDRLMGQVFEQFCRNLEGVVSLLATRLKSIKAADRVAPFQELFDAYLAQVDPKIDLLLFIGDVPGTSEERVRDEAASFLRNLAVFSANSAKAYKFSIDVLMFADKAAYSKSIRCELVEIAKVLVNNQKNLDTNGDAEGRFKRKEELLATIAAALVRNDYKTALKFLDEIIALNFASSVAERNRRAQIATLWATQLYNSGIRQINAGYSAAGQSFLEEAASIESNPTELAKINRALTALRGGARKAAAPQTSSRNANDEREWTYQQLKVATSRNDKSQSLLLIERLLLGATEEEASRLRKLHESIERGFVSPFSSVPPLKNINGFGTTIYGDSICIVALFIPIFWLGRYKVEHLQDGRYSFQGKRRLQNWQVIFNWCVAVGTVVLVIIFNVSGSKK